jgi:hypothetical protein
VWEGIKQIVSSVWEGIKGIVGTFAGFFEGTFNNVKNTIVNIWTAIWDKIKSVINAMIGGIEGFANGAVNGINAVIRALNRLHFTVPDWVPGLGGKTFGFNIGTLSKVSIPRLAEGGIISTPTLAMVGEAGTEAVVPLEHNTEWMNSLASAVVAGLAGSEMLSVLKQLLVAVQEGKILAVDKQVLGQIVSSALNSSFKSAGYTTVNI